MYEVEVYVGDPYPEDLTMPAYEAMEYYEERKMSINLTRLWQLSLELGGEEYQYRYFLAYLISTIMHEFLHLFFYDNNMHEENTEQNVYRLTRNLRHACAQIDE